MKRVRRGNASSFAQEADLPSASSPEPGQQQEELEVALEYEEEEYPKDQGGGS